MGMLLTGCSSTQSAYLIPVTEVADESETDDPEVLHESANAADAQADTGPELLYVHVCGEVNQPGVYELTSGARVYQVIEMAGGMTSDAALDAVNQAAVLYDGQQLVIPSVLEWSEKDRETDSQGTANEKASSENDLVNINEATKEELMTLPGIGESKAADIVAYRENQGRFLAVEDIMNVSGIKEAVFARIKDKITVTQ